MKLVFVVLSFVAMSATAAETKPTNVETAPTTVTTTASAPGKVHGMAEFRPSYTTKAGEVHSENAAELGYDFSKNTSVFYRQEFNSNLYHPSNVSGANVLATDGYIKALSANLVQFEGTPFSINYEGRWFFPTPEKKRDAGMITSMRNYVWLKYTATKSFNVYLAEAPGFHIFNQAGFKGAANPVFENRVELVGEYVFTDKLKLVFPFKLTTTKYRDFQTGAKNNDAWGNYLYVHPELTYKVNANWKVGTAFYSGALTNAGFSDLTLGDGLSGGVFQTFVAASL